MPALLLFARFAEANLHQFGSGLESWAQENLPAVQLFDADSLSDKSYISQLTGAAQQATVFVLWIKSDQPATPPGALAPLLETWLRHKGKKLLVLEGEHAQTERMGNADFGAFCKGKTAAELKPRVLDFFRNATPEA